MANSLKARASAALSRWRWWIAIVGLLFVAYTAAGFLLVPRLAKDAIQSYVENTLKRHVAIGDLTFNPFTLAAEVDGFALSESDGTPIAGFDRLHIDFQLSSIFNGAWTFNEISFDKPALNILVSPDGKLNLAALAPPPDSNKPAEGPADIPALRIGSFSIRDGNVKLEDRSRGEPFATTLTPINFSLKDFRTAANFQNAYSFAASTTAGETLTWAGEFSVQPFGSAGKFAVGRLKAATIASYLQAALPFAFTSGTLDVDGNYRLTIADQMGLSLQLPSVKLHDFGVAPKGAGAGAPWIRIPELDVTNVAFALPDGKASVDRIDITGADASVTRDPDGGINLLRLLPASPATPAASARTPAAPAFALTIGTVALRNASLAVEDQTTKPAANLALTPIDLTISGYSSAPGSTLKLDASVTVDGKGRLTAQGDMRLSPLTSNLNIDAANLDLAPLQPYIAQNTGIELQSGQFSARAKIAMNPEASKDQAHLQFAGDVTIDNLATRDRLVHQDFVKWQRLEVSGIDYAQGPDRLTIARVRAVKPYGKVLISPDQTLNLVAALSPANAPTGKPAASPVPEPQRASAKPAPMPIAIRQVEIEDGSSDFSDLSIQPNFAARMIGLRGTISGLSSAPDSRADVKLAGNVDTYAPVAIDGRINLLSAALYTDIALKFSNMELTTFNPYSGKYAGYDISKGKLTTELHYKIDNRKLDLQHHIVLDQLEFGTPTNSKDAVPLPVRLAVALLKDRKGVIDLQLPVTGSMDDPQFRVGPIIWQAFVNLLTKVVTAPFTLIGSLFGGGEELAYVDFPAGSADLSPAEKDKLAKLAHALTERPELKLDVPLGTLTVADDAALSQAAFDAAVAAASSGAPSMPTTAQQAAATQAALSNQQQRLAGLAVLYQQQIGSAPNYPQPATPDADAAEADIAYLETALRPRFAPSDSARAALARARADAVQSAILGGGSVMPAQVFLTERASNKASNNSARMELTLQ